jgi:hypothetical protein
MEGMMMGSRKTVPSRMFRMVPFGDRHCESEGEEEADQVEKWGGSREDISNHLLKLELYKGKEKLADEADETQRGEGGLALHSGFVWGDSSTLRDDTGLE